MVVDSKPLTSQGVHGFESHPCRQLPATRGTDEDLDRVPVG
jgi:hypothetical protein